MAGPEGLNYSHQCSLFQEKLLSKLEESEPEPATCQEEEVREYLSRWQFCCA